METVNKLLLGIIGCALLSSCSNKPPLPKTKIVDTKIMDYNNGSRVTILTQNAINGNVIKDTDNSLNIVSKADNAKLIGLKTLQIAATLFGGGNANVYGHGKEQLKGNHIASVKNKTMDYLIPELRATLENIDIQTVTDSKITIEPYKFKLMYESLGNNNYEFRYSTTISVGDFYHLCSSGDLLPSERVQPIDRWEKNNYALTQVLTKKIIKNCFVKINEVQKKEKLKNALLKTTSIRDTLN